MRDARCRFGTGWCFLPGGRICDRIRQDALPDRIDPRIGVAAQAAQRDIHGGFKINIGVADEGSVATKGVHAWVLKSFQG